MNLTVITSDLKYLFNVQVSHKFWHLTHLLNYALLPLLYIHALRVSNVMQQMVSYYLITGLLVIAMISGLYKIKKTLS